MLTGWQVIGALKVAVAAVTVLLLTSMIPLLRGNTRLHGRINIAFFALTLVALLSLELLIRFLDPHVFDYFDDATRRALSIHLTFALPSAALLPAMLFTGLTHRRRLHLTLASVFAILWTGTFITGVFFLPHSPP